ASLAVLVGLAAPRYAASAPDPAAEIVSAKRALHAAVSWGGTREILEARARFAALSAARPRSAALHYWVALADWRAVPPLGGSSSSSRASGCSRARRRPATARRPTGAATTRTCGRDGPRCARATPRRRARSTSRRSRRRPTTDGSATSCCPRPRSRWRRAPRHG